MSDELFPDPSGEQVGDRPGDLARISQQQDDFSSIDPHTLEKQRLEGLAQEILELKLVFLSDAEHMGRDLEQLRRQVNWLTGVLIAAIAIMGGTLTWLTFSLQSEQAQLAQRLESIAADAVAVERIDTLEEQLSALSDQLPDNIAANIAANEAELQELQTQIADISGDVRTRRQTIAILADALQDLINQENGNLQEPPAAPTSVVTPVEPSPTDSPTEPAN